MYVTAKRVDKIYSPSAVYNEHLLTFVACTN